MRDNSTLVKSLLVAAIIAIAGSFVDVQVLKAEFTNAQKDTKKEISHQKELIETKMEAQKKELKEIKKLVVQVLLKMDRTL